MFTHSQLIRRRIRRNLLGVSFALLLAVAALGLFADLSTAQSGPDSPAASTANVIVQFDDSASVIREIEFSEPISGFTALISTGLEVAYSESSFGPAVCSIEGVGCPADDCFCQCTGEGPCRFWGYQFWDGQAWQSYDIGVGGTVISESGAIEGFVWGDGSLPLTPATQTVAAGKALTALEGAQAEDSGYGSIGGSVESAIAFGANRQQSAEIQPAGGAGSLLGYLMLNGADYTNPPAETAAIAPAAVGKLATGAVASDTCWAHNAQTPAAVFDESSGAYGSDAGVNAWGILGALAYGDSVPESAVVALKASIQPDGGWEWMSGFGSDTNTTSLAVQAMIGTGTAVTATEVISGLIFLQGAQNDDGGFTYDPVSSFGTDSDANSTAYVTQALYAAGEDPNGPDWTRGEGATPIGYLLDAQLEDGTFEWQPGTGSNVLATQQAVPALLGQSFPLASGIDGCHIVFLPLVGRPN